MANTCGRVLIVEDDRLSRESLSRLLTYLGFAVDAAATVAGALALLASRPHCLILDVQLPDGSGLEVARSARAAQLDCRIAFLTGSTAEEQLPFKPDAFFEKPVHPDQVLSWVQRACAAAPVEE